MRNIGKLMQQAKKMQEQMAKMQEELASLEVVGEAGGGMVKVVAGGDRRIKSVSIDESLWREEDKALLEDLVAAAVNAAMQKAEEAVAEKQKAMLAGLPLPPGFSL